MGRRHGGQSKTSVVELRIPANVGASHLTISDALRDEARSWSSASICGISHALLALLRRLRLGLGGLSVACCSLERVARRVQSNLRSAMGRSVSTMLSPPRALKLADGAPAATDDDDDDADNEAEDAKDLDLDNT
eukprot:6207031-Pleurochrysis_carterae.AAC.1